METWAASGIDYFAELWRRAAEHAPANQPATIADVGAFAAFLASEGLATPQAASIGSLEGSELSGKDTSIEKSVAGSGFETGEVMADLMSFPVRRWQETFQEPRCSHAKKTGRRLSGVRCQGCNPRKPGRGGRRLPITPARCSPTCAPK